MAAMTLSEIVKGLYGPDTDKTFTITVTRLGWLHYKWEAAAPGGHHEWGYTHTRKAAEKAAHRACRITAGLPVGWCSTHTYNPLTGAKVAHQGEGES